MGGKGTRKKSVTGWNFFQARGDRTSTLQKGKKISKKETTRGGEYIYFKTGGRSKDTPDLVQGKMLSCAEMALTKSERGLSGSGNLQGGEKGNWGGETGFCLSRRVSDLNSKGGGGEIRSPMGETRRIFHLKKKKKWDADQNRNLQKN